jgi:hypothetical protein
MKLIILTLILTGCTSTIDYHSTQESELKYHAGQSLTVKTGFYKDCKMKLTGYKYVTVVPEGPAYTGIVDCYGMPSFENSQLESNLESK